MSVESLEINWSESPEEADRREFMEAVSAEFPVEVEDRVTLDAYLDHMLERLAERYTKIRETDEIADRRIFMVQQWRQTQNAREIRECQWLEIEIQAATEGYDFGKKSRSRSLPNGSFGYRKSPERIEIIDMGKAVAFAREHAIPVKEEVLKTPLKEHLKATGEIADGCELVPGEDSFFIKAG